MSYDHDKEHGVTYVLGAERRRVTIWNGCHHQYNRVMVNKIRFENDAAPGTYLSTRRVTRPYQDGQTEEFRDGWHSRAIQPPQEGHAQPITGSDPCIGRVTGMYAWPRGHHLERARHEAALEDWTMYGTADGDRWIADYHERRLSDEYGFTTRTPT